MNLKNIILSNDDGYETKDRTIINTTQISGATTIYCPRYITSNNIQIHNVLVDTVKKVEISISIPITLSIIIDTTEVRIVMITI